MKECSNCGISKNNTLETCPLCGMPMSYIPDDGLLTEKVSVKHTLTEIEKLRIFSKKKRKGWPFYNK
jgi:hypothetical protein